MRLPFLWPEVGDVEFSIEVRTEVIHYTDWEEDIHAELVRMLANDA